MSEKLLTGYTINILRIVCIYSIFILINIIFQFNYYYINNDDSSKVSESDN